MTVRRSVHIALDFNAKVRVFPTEKGIEIMSKYHHFLGYNHLPDIEYVINLNGGYLEFALHVFIRIFGCEPDLYELQKEPPQLIYWREE